MAVEETRTVLHPLCYEHHLEMNLVDIHSKRNISGLVYACPKPDCPIHFNSPVRSSVVSLTPCTRCPHPGRPMFLAKVRPRNRTFRLSRCPLSGRNARLTTARPPR